MIFKISYSSAEKDDFERDINTLEDLFKLQKEENGESLIIHNNHEIEIYDYYME